MIEILFGIITVNLVAINIAHYKLNAKIDLNKKSDDEFKKDQYRDHITEFYNRLMYHSDKAYPKEMYIKSFEQYDAYKALGGNSYIDDLHMDIKENYNKHYGGN